MRAGQKSQPIQKRAWLARTGNITRNSWMLPGAWYATCAAAGNVSDAAEAAHSGTAAGRGANRHRCMQGWGRVCGSPSSPLPSLEECLSHARAGTGTRLASRCGTDSVSVARRACGLPWRWTARCMRVVLQRARGHKAAAATMQSGRMWEVLRVPAEPSRAGGITRCHGHLQTTGEGLK